jgi:acyl-CoA thioester hydrolase
MALNIQEIRVRYAETDQMGIVYYGNYPQYFEVARTELLRALGFTYRALEAEGIMLPVRELQIRYRAPARYDDKLRIETEVRDLPQRRITFHHRIFNQQGELLTTGSVELVFVAIASGRPCGCPPYLQEAFKAFLAAD